VEASGDSTAGLALSRHTPPREVVTA